jgi:succinate dehydrogenase/fumarate reductase flavoprotein subunit
MVEFFQRETDVQFMPMAGFPDYHPGAPGALAGGRAIVAAPYSGHELGEHIKTLRPPLREITFVGMMFNVSQEVSHFFNVTRSLKSAVYVTRRLAQHAREMLLHGRAMRLTNGNALAARLAGSAFKLDIPIWLESPVRGLIRENNAVHGVEVETAAGAVSVQARRGVVLAAGGFPHDIARRKKLFPHAPTGVEHLSPAPPGNTGDGIRLAAAAGAELVDDIANAAAWIPVSRVPRGNGKNGVFPHLIDRYKPGIIAVTRRGVRFVNEANSYHDFGQALQHACENETETVAFLLCDHPALRRYGLGFVKPFPLPLLPHLRSGYLLRGQTLAELAQRAGIDAEKLQQTVEHYNAGARHGEDPQFGKGSTVYNRYLGDAGHQPNPCLAPLVQAPFYAVKVVLGDIGTFAGIRTDQYARVLDNAGQPIGGLYAVGNDAASIMGGSYPGGGITLGPAMTFAYIAARHLAGVS